MGYGEGVGNGSGLGVEVEVEKSRLISMSITLMKATSLAWKWIHDRSSWATEGSRPRIGIFRAGKDGRDDGEPSVRFEKIEQQTLRHSCGAAARMILWY